MTDRIYTIPAREVVQGMEVDVSGDGEWRLVTRAREGMGKVAWRHPDGFSAAIPASDIMSVKVSGPSPRDVLCTCSGVVWEPRNETPEGAMERSCVAACEHWSKHAATCPVRTLRIRLWPVGGRWGLASQAWRVTDDRDGCDWFVTENDLRNEFADFFDTDAGLLREAFCEPEPTT